MWLCGDDAGQHRQGHPEDHPGSSPARGREAIDHEDVDVLGTRVLRVADRRDVVEARDGVIVTLASVPATPPTKWPMPHEAATQTRAV